VGDLKRSHLDILKQNSLVRVEVRRHSDKHFVNQYSEEVPVDAFGVASTSEHFRSKVSH